MRDLIYAPGTKLIDESTGEVFVVFASDERVTYYRGATGSGDAITSEIASIFAVDEIPLPNFAKSQSVLDTQEGGDHYKKLGDYQPWEVLRHWLTPEEFRGYMKGTAIAYLARERDKGGELDIKKAAHTLQGLIELMERS